MKFIGIDLEGVLIPEIWVALSNKTGILSKNTIALGVNINSQLLKIRIQNIRFPIL